MLRSSVFLFFFFGKTFALLTIFGKTGLAGEEFLWRNYGNLLDWPLFIEKEWYNLRNCSNRLKTFPVAKKVAFFNHFKEEFLKDDVSLLQSQSVSVESYVFLFIPISLEFFRCAANMPPACLRETGGILAAQRKNSREIGIVSLFKLRGVRIDR